jgi:hypothetical protein
MKKENVVHAHNGILFSHKKDTVLSFAIAWMELEVIALIETFCTKKDRCQMSLVIFEI